MITFSINLLEPVVLAAAFYAGTQWPLRPSQQNEAWRAEGFAAGLIHMPALDCPYRSENMTAYTFWQAGRYECARLRAEGKL